MCSWQYSTWVYISQTSGAIILNATLDDIGRTLRNRVDRGLQTSTDLEWKNRAVNNTNIRGPIDLERGVNHTTDFLRHRGGCGNGVKSWIDLYALLASKLSILATEKKNARTARFDKSRPCLILGIGSNGV